MSLKNNDSEPVYNMATVITYKPEQFLHETKTWNRQLEFFKQENAFLKNRLAVVVDHKTDKDFLALAEHFQNRFIINDEFIDELRHDISLQEGFFAKKKDNAIFDKEMTRKQDKFRNEMKYFENNFMSLKNEFNKYLASAL
ncbi:MAG TPA: hypothetical protein VK489_06605 [Ferruginibacter sp.]|nr:hypothetical protein [Ferruginibacter sp.]